MMMFSVRAWRTILVAFATVFIPQSGAAYDPPDCMVSKDGLAFFHDDTIQVLRPVKATSSEYIWEQTADLGKTSERIGSFEVSDTTLFDPGSSLLPLATLTPTILVSSFSIYSLEAEGVKSPSISADDSVIDAYLTSHPSGLSSIAYLSMRVDDGKHVDLHLVSSASPETADWTKLDTISDVRCFSGIPAETSVATTFDARSTQWVVCGGSEGADVYQVREKRLVHVQLLSEKPMLKVVVADSTEAAFFLLSDEPDGHVYVTSPSDGWKLHAAGKPKSKLSSMGRFFGADARTWVYQMGGAVELGVKDAESWKMEEVSTLRDGRLLDVASDPLRILSTNGSLTYYERSAAGWSAPVTIVDELLRREELENCGKDFNENEEVRPIWEMEGSSPEPASNGCGCTSQNILSQGWRTGMWMFGLALVVGVRRQSRNPQRPK